MRWSLASFVVASLAGCAGQLYPLRPIDHAALRAARAQCDALAREHAGRPAVVLSSEHSFEHVLHGGSGSWTVHTVGAIRYLVLDEHDEEVGTFKLTVDKGEELGKVQLAILDPDGRIRELGRDDLRKEEKPGGRTSFKLAFPALHKGAIVEARVETIYPDPEESFARVLRRHFWLGGAWPIVERRVVFAVPSKWLLMVKRTPGQPTSTLREREGKLVVEQRVRDLAAVPEEPFAPHRVDDTAYLRVGISYLRSATIAFFGASSWKDFAAREKKYVIDNDAVFSGRVAEETRRITAGLIGGEAKLRAITRFLQRRIRVAEQHEEKSFPAILSTREGTEWQIAALAHRMLLKAGLDSRFVLVHDAFNGALDRSYLQAGEFDEAAVLVRIDGREHLAFPYLKHLPLGLIPHNLQGRPALVIGKEGFAGFITTPVLDGKLAKVAQRSEVTILKDGTLEVRELHEHSGLAAFELRRKLTRLNADEVAAELKKMVDQKQGRIDYRGSRLMDLRDAEKPLRVEHQYTVRDLVTLARDEAVLQTAGVLSGQSLVKGALDDRARVRRVAIPFNQELTREVLLRLPAGWSLQTKLESGQQQNALGELRIQVASEPGEVRVGRQISLRRGLWPARSSTLLSALLRDRALPSLVFRTAAAPASAPTP